MEMFGIESIGTAELKINRETRAEFDVFDINHLELFADRGIVVGFLMRDDNLLSGELIDVDTDDSRMILKTDKHTVSFLYNVFDWFIIIDEKDKNGTKMVKCQMCGDMTPEHHIDENEEGMLVCPTCLAEDEFTEDFE